MQAKTYSDAAAFLRHTQAELESNEAANSLMLGICGRLIRHPERFKAAPCLKTTGDEHGLVLAAIMTPPHNLIVYAHRGDLEGATAILVRNLVSEGWPVPGVLGPSEVAREIAQRWAQVTGREGRLERRLQVYELREVISPVPERGRLRPATEADIESVARWWCEFHREIFGQANQEEADRGARSRIRAGDIYLWEDERPLSIAMKTRPTRRGISVSLVYTPPALRRKGYATACVGELSRMLLEAGWEHCALFADLANAAANRVYERIGYRPLCVYDEYAFSKESPGGNERT